MTTIPGKTARASDPETGEAAVPEGVAPQGDEPLGDAPTERLGPLDLHRAREAYAKGQALFRAGDYQRSEISFWNAYEATSNPIVLLAVAETRERRGDVPGTLEVLERYLEERPDAPDRVQVGDRAKALRASLGTLVIQTDPAGASVEIDGRPVSSETPARLYLPAGDHQILVSFEGSPGIRRTVTMALGKTERIEVALDASDPRFGIGALEAEGGGANGQATDGAVPSATTETIPASVWVASGVAAAGLVSGTVFGFLALSEQAKFDEAPKDTTADRGERFALFSDLAFGLAAASALTAIVLYVKRDAKRPQEEPDDLAGVRVGAGLAADGPGATLMASGRF